MLGSGRNPAVVRRRDGADDESSRRTAEGHGQEDYLVGCGRDCWGHRSDDASVARSIGGARIREPGRPPEGKTEPQADSAGDDGRVAPPVSGEVLRPQHVALPRKTPRRARDQDELYVGAKRTARSRPCGKTAQAGTAPSE